MLDLELIKARLAAVDLMEPRAYKRLLQHAAEDLDALVAEVERLTGHILLHAATQPSEAFTAQDRKLWASIGIEDIEDIEVNEMDWENNENA